MTTRNTSENVSEDKTAIEDIMNVIEGDNNNVIQIKKEEIEIITLSEDEDKEEEVDGRRQAATTKKLVEEIMKPEFTFKGLSITKNGRVLVEDENVEIVTRETKRRYNLYIENKLEQIEKMEKGIPKLTGQRKEFAINEVNTGERMADKEVKRLTEMIVVNRNAKIFAKY